MKLCAISLAVAVLFSRTARASTLYASEVFQNRVQQFTLAGAGSPFAHEGGAGLAADSAGNVYVALQPANTIARYTPDGVRTVFATTGLNGPRALAFDTADNLYVSNQGDGTIERFVGGVGSVFASGFSQPDGMAFDNSGNLYVVEAHSPAKIVKITSDGTKSTFASSGLSLPVGLAFDNAGNLYVANSGNSTIEGFTPNGVGSLFANMGLNDPQGLAFDRSTGVLYAANLGNATIESFAPNGVPSLFANTSSSGMPLFVAITPEPSAVIFVMFAATLAWQDRVRRPPNSRRAAGGCA